VTKIVDQSGNILVRYEYDAYGNILSMTGSHENTLGKRNSLTYRSYKYDREINLYYLNSRYYNPEIGRFISSDGLLGPVGNILGHNMYAYTQNNPVMFVDPSGEFADIIPWLLKLAGGFAIADGPLPIGDIISVVLLVTVAIIMITESTDMTSVYEKVNEDSEKASRKYTVYALKNDAGEIVYVGRVLTKNYESRMAHHFKTGRGTP